MTLTCSDGLSHTDSLGKTRVAHFTLQGCSQGGCKNAAGDSASYILAGPGNTGLEMSSTGGVAEYIYAAAFGGYGIRIDGQDAKAFHDTVYSNDEWYYYGGYKGVGESAASPEVNAVTTGTTGSVALSWTAVSGATGYVIYRGTASGSESVFYITNTNSFTDTGATGAVGTVTNVVTTATATAPATITANPSTTGGALTAGTYYYEVTSIGTDALSLGSGWHGSIEFSGADVMADWIEAYGLFDAPTVYTYHHLADILTGGGDGQFDHLWPQLGLNGIAQPYGYGFGDNIENVRVDFARLEGIWINDINVQVRGGLIDGSCTTPNAVTINAGQDGITPAGICDQFFGTGGGGINVSDLNTADNYGFGPTYKTADIYLGGNLSAYHNVSGAFQYTANGGINAGTHYEPQAYALTNVTGPTPNMLGLYQINPIDASPISYTGFMNVSANQDFYIKGGNGNVTLIYDSTYLVTCSGQNINLGTVNGFLHFRFTNNGVYGLRAWVAQVCSSSPAQHVIASSETVAFSAVPTFSVATRASVITLTADVTSFTLAASTDGQEKTLTFCQDSTGGHTAAAPTNVHGFFTVGPTANKCSSQHYTYSNAQSGWLADSPGVTNE
jgi:hypothetical protein